MRIHEIVDTIPADQAYVYICHAPDGHCRVLAQNGGVYDSPEIEDPRNLSQAIGMLFDSHWRGANAHEIAAHPWNGPRVMRTDWTDPDQEQADGRPYFDPEVDRQLVADSIARKPTPPG